MSDESGELLVAIRALVALAIADRDEAVERGVASKRSEIVLADAGLGYQAIAGFSGRSPEAVRSALRRRKGGTDG